MRVRQTATAMFALQVFGNAVRVHAAADAARRSAGVPFIAAERDNTQKTVPASAGREEERAG